MWIIQRIKYNYRLIQQSFLPTISCLHDDRYPPHNPLYQFFLLKCPKLDFISHVSVLPCSINIGTKLGRRNGQLSKHSFKLFKVMYFIVHEVKELRMETYHTCKENIFHLYEFCNFSFRSPSTPKHYKIIETL